MTRVARTAVRDVARMGACALVIACSRSVDSQPPASTNPVVAARPDAALDELDRMDGRAPVPLLPTMASHQKQNMRDHLVVVEQVVTALATADFSAVEKAATRIGFSQSMGQMCTHMGAGAPGFAERAIEFHHTADRIGAAAREGDGVGVLTALGTTLQACTSCHAVWKQQVVDEPTWRTLASSPPTTEHRSH